LKNKNVAQQRINLIASSSLLTKIASPARFAQVLRNILSVIYLLNYLL